ncbi:MAG: response regulator transcription factor [Candidatus Thorarchaeota archaeon]|jgi:DNA-binding response OmpR family regulator
MNTDNKKILVVDDEEMTTELAKTFLEKHGFVVVIAKDGEEALEIAHDEVPDLILLDVMLPTIDGFEVCKQLKSHDTFKKTPILMFTAKGLSSDMEKGEAAGANEYIVKPFSGKALVATIRKHLGMTE